MAQITFLQGEDVIIELPITANSLPVDLTDSTSLRVQLLITKNNVQNVYASYSSTPKSGYGVCRMKTGMGNTNIIQVLVTRADSVNFDPGVLSFAVVTTFANSDFSNGLNTEYDFPNYGTVLPGIAKTEVIP